MGSSMWHQNLAASCNQHARSCDFNSVYVCARAIFSGLVFLV